jgi:DNA-binding NarL/FixJ family response regulator
MNKNAGSIQRKARVLVVDDHPLVRQGLVQLITQQDDLIVCGETATHTEALSVLSASLPDLLVLDLRLKEGDGLEFIKFLKGRFPGLPVLVLSQFDEELYAERSLRAGASGYVMKEQASEEVLGAIRTVLAGRIYITPDLNAVLLQRLISAKPQAGEMAFGNLSDRELQVLQLLGSGIGNREIALQLHLSIKTVETYREHLKHKLSLRNSDELVYFARQWVEKHLGTPGPVSPSARKESRKQRGAPPPSLPIAS